MAKSPGTPAPTEPSTALLAAVRRLLRPLVRVLIARGINYPYLAGLLKGVYVEVAEAEFQVAGKRQTDSRISLITGVHRKDVKRLRQAEGEDLGAPAAASLGAQAIGLWLGSPEFLAEDGRPKALPRSRPPGGGASFETLIQEVSKDVRPRTVLDEWLRLGLVVIDAKDLVCLDTSAFVPDQDQDQLAYYFGRNLHDHMAASAHNLLGERPAFLERAVFYDRLSPESVAHLTKLAREAGTKLLVEVNQAALERAEADEGQADASQRMTLGVYFYSADEAPSDEDGDDA